MLAVLEGTVTGFVLALTAVGLSIVFGVMRIVNVAHGEFFMLGAIVTWYVATVTGHFLPALVVAPLAVGLLAVVADRLVLRRIGYDPEKLIDSVAGRVGLAEHRNPVMQLLADAGVHPIVVNVIFFGASAIVLVILLTSLQSWRARTKRARRQS